MQTDHHSEGRREQQQQWGGRTPTCGELRAIVS